MMLSATFIQVVKNFFINKKMMVKAYELAKNIAAAARRILIPR